MNRMRIVVLIFFCILLTACRNDESSIPEAEVYVRTTYSEYMNLMRVNSCFIYSKDDTYPSNFKLGYGGVIIFRDLEGLVRSCDLACPYEALPGFKLEVEMPFAFCLECGSRFDLSYGVGNPVGGPAECGMKIYNKIRDTGEYIMVTN